MGAYHCVWTKSLLFMGFLYDWCEERFEFQAIADDILAKFVPAHVNIFYCFGGIVLTSFLFQVATGFALTPHLSLCERCYFHDLGILTAQLSRIPELVSREKHRVYVSADATRDSVTSAGASCQVLFAGKSTLDLLGNLLLQQTHFLDASFAGLHALQAKVCGPQKNSHRSFIA